MSTDTNTKTDSKIVIHKKKPSDKLLKLINEAVDTGIKLTSMINQIWDQGAEEGFSREEIAEIVRPIARQKGLNKNQVYYLTHKPELQERAKQQYGKLKAVATTTAKSLNIQTSVPQDQEDAGMSATTKQENRDVDLDNQVLGNFVIMIHDMCYANKQFRKTIVDEISKEVKKQQSKGYKTKDEDKQSALEKIADQVILNKRMSPMVNKALGGSGEKQSDEYYVTWIGLDSPYQTAFYSAQQRKAKREKEKAKDDKKRAD